MIIALPSNHERVAGHFSKAPQLTIIDTQHSSLLTLDNPASQAGGCYGKTAVVQVLDNLKVDTVIVRHIGEKMLARLLAKGTRVLQLDRSSDIKDAINAPHMELTSCEQGLPSRHHQKKHHHDHCCSSHGSCGHKPCCGTRGI